VAHPMAVVILVMLSSPMWFWPINSTVSGFSSWLPLPRPL